MSGKILSKRKIKTLKAKAVKVKEEEYQEVVRAKERESLHRQKDYRRTTLTRFFKEEVLTELKTQIDAETNFRKDFPNKESKDIISVQWMGKPMPFGMLKCEYNLHYDQYREILLQENHLKQALKNDGMNDKQILEVLNGKMIKEDRNAKPKNKNNEKGSPDIDYVG